MVNLVLLACVLKVTTKRGRQLFPARKVHPRENPGYAYGRSDLQKNAGTRAEIFLRIVFAFQVDRACEEKRVQVSA